jgi:serine/threonine protein kinase
MIAISYRREDTMAVTGRLYDRLEAKFGKSNVFMDFDSIRPGFDFREQIKATIKRSVAVIAVIGPQWVGERPDGSRRIDDPLDFVRFELACALESGIPVIPVLVNDTPMPRPETLPSDIAGLAFRHALPLDSGLDFRNHADRLITAVTPRSGAGQKLFGRYILERILGRGGMGIVWLARDEQLETPVALKVLPDTLCHDRASLTALKRETKLGLNLAHPNIVRIYDFQQDEYAAAIAMEYVDGPPISEVQQGKEQQVFDPAELTDLIEALCDALHYAHTRRKIVHRDLKPRNLMLTSEGDLKITDFGISRSISDSMALLTGMLGSAGSPPYISPQQWDGDPPSPLDDIYSVGATLYELLTSKPPLMGVIDSYQVHNKVPPPVGQRRVDLGITGKQPIPALWEEAIAACLAKDRGARPQTILELRSRLLDARSTRDIIAETAIPEGVDLTRDEEVQPTESRTGGLAPPQESTAVIPDTVPETHLEQTTTALPQPIVEDLTPPPLVQREERVSLPEPTSPVTQESPVQADLKASEAPPQSIIDEVALPPAVEREERVSVPEPSPSLVQEPPVEADLKASVALPQPIVEDAAPPPTIEREERVSVPEPSPPVTQEPPVETDLNASATLPEPLVDDLPPPPAVKRKRKRGRQHKSPVAQEPPEAQLEYSSRVLPPSIIDEAAQPPAVEQQHVPVPEAGPSAAQAPPVETDQAPHSDASTRLHEVQTAPSEAAVISAAETAIPVSPQLHDDIAEIAPVLEPVSDAQSATEAFARIEPPDVIGSDEQAPPTVTDDVATHVQPPAPTAVSSVEPLEQSLPVSAPERAYDFSAILATAQEAFATWWRKKTFWLWPSAGAAAVLILVLLLWPRSHRLEQPSSRTRESASVHTPTRTEKAAAAPAKPEQTTAPVSAIKSSATPATESLTGTNTQLATPGPPEPPPVSASNDVQIPPAAASPAATIAEASPSTTSSAGAPINTVVAAPAAVPSVSPENQPTPDTKNSAASAKSASANKKPKPAKSPSRTTTETSQATAKAPPRAAKSSTPAPAKPTVRKTPPPQPFEGVPGN